MNQNATAYKTTQLAITSLRYANLLRAFFGGLLIPFGFAPFHLPGLAILGLALLFAQLRTPTLKQSFWIGFVFGLGFFGLGVSWVYVSIHEYGHLNALFSALITLLFIVYLALYLGLMAAAYKALAMRCSLLFQCFLFCALWCLGEYLRSTLMGGFPWLQLGFGQIDTPLKYLLPIVGTYGVSFLTCLAAAFLAASIQTTPLKRQALIVAFVAILLTPTALQFKKWTATSSTPLSVGVIQANLSMRDKWDESLFWQLLEHYKKHIDQLIGQKELIVMPESAIPLPPSYISDFIDTTDLHAKRAGSSILLGIPQPTSLDETYYYNSLISLGEAQGYYLKQHLVPFGEFIPHAFEHLVNWLAIPMANLKPGHKNQPLILVHNHPIATLICYELAYPQLLRLQLPKAEWIVSISDDGWFGHSFAMYQQLQIAQVLSLQTGRFQVIANNDGLSSIVNTRGEIIASLPAFSAGVLEANIYPSTGFTPWVYFGDKPILALCILIVFLVPFRRFRSSPSKLWKKT